jgi:hypothetical protein
VLLWAGSTAERLVPDNAHEQWEGALAGLAVRRAQDGGPASYELAFEDGPRIPLNARLGEGFRVEFTGVVSCRHCGAESRKSFGGGYCYDCFSTLARCDLCVVSPDRCHYAAGTCREPEWGESFCMQPHLVYLANTSGLKVGITRAGREIGRWLDQGAIQGLVILEAATRRDAGLAEAAIATVLPDRTDWRRMLRADVPPLDLPAAWRRLRDSELSLPDGVTTLEGRAAVVVSLAYPLTANAAPEHTLRLENGPVSGNLKGMKGQYLVLGNGAFNVRAHAGYRVRLSIGAPMEEETGGEQLGLFG